MQGHYFSVVSSHGRSQNQTVMYLLSKKLIYLQPETELPREEIDISVLNLRFLFISHLKLYVSAQNTYFVKKFILRSMARAITLGKFLRPPPLTRRSLFQ